MQTKDNQIRGRIHWDFLMSSAFQGLATYTNLWDYSEMIPCIECKNHFNDWLRTKIISDFVGSKQQVDMLYELYTQIQTRKGEPIKEWQERFLFYYKRI